MPTPLRQRLLCFVLHLLLFIALQGGDLATTLWFLHLGVSEGNPIVAFALRLCGTPAVSLGLAKAAACGLAYLAWRRGNHGLLRRINLMFALCVVWNLAAIAQR